MDVSRTVGIQFQGVTPAEDPQVFLATSRPGENAVSSGVGLALFDEQQRQIIPNATAVSWLPINTRELVFTRHYSVECLVYVDLSLTPAN